MKVQLDSNVLDIYTDDNISELKPIELLRFFNKDGEVDATTLSLYAGSFTHSDFVNIHPGDCAVFSTGINIEGYEDTEDGHLNHVPDYESSLKGQHITAYVVNEKLIFSVRNVSKAVIVLQRNDSYGHWYFMNSSIHNIQIENNNRQAGEKKGDNW